MTGYVYLAVHTHGFGDENDLRVLVGPAGSLEQLQHLAADMSTPDGTTRELTEAEAYELAASQPDLFWVERDAMGFPDIYQTVDGVVNPRPAREILELAAAHAMTCSPRCPPGRSSVAER